uniref:Uncharacterized protein n=1 Tax=Amphimedon queenslandica TaxID=400682 RepID=A0A1X7TPQ4_AMPQE
PPNWMKMADFFVNRQAEHFPLLSSHPYCRSYFELSFCFITLFISPAYSHPLPIPVLVNFAFRSQGACPSSAMKTQVYSAESYD